MFSDENQEYLAVINAEEQYSLWPASKEIPAGWTEVRRGSRQDCLAFISAEWSDMRPRSLREQMTDG
jgi:MbtH protein